MSMQHSFVPRFDAGGASVFDDEKIGVVRKDRSGLHTVRGLGREVGSVGEAKVKMAAYLANKWNLDPESRDVKDAAADFVTSGLEKVLGPGENIRRNEGEKFLFVPGAGTMVIPSRNVLPPGWRTNSYKVRQLTGQASWTEPNAVSKLERAGFTEEKKEQGAHYYGTAWGYSLPETWEAGVLGEDILGEYQAGATLALDRMREKVSMWGEVTLKLPGFATLADAIVVEGGQQYSSNAVTAQQMLERLGNVEHLFKRANLGMKPGAIMMPDADVYALNNTFFGDNGGGDSVMKRAKEQYPWMNNITESDNMQFGNADGNATRWVVYLVTGNDLYVEHTETMVFGPFENMMDTAFVLLRRHGGVVNKRPERTMYVDFTA